MRKISWRQCYFAAPSKFNPHTHVTIKKGLRRVQQLDQVGWVGPFASKLTMATERDMYRVVTYAVHAVQIPTFSPTSTDEIEPGQIILSILRACYAYYQVAVSASVTRRPIFPFAAHELSTAVRGFLCYAVRARDAGYDRVKIMDKAARATSSTSSSWPRRTKGITSTAATAF